MNFSAWHPLHDAAAAAPDVPGVLQARAEALLTYPSGRSAMVLYDCSDPGESLRSFVAGRGAGALARAEELGGRWVRFGRAREPRRELERLLAAFTDRFGAPPAATLITAEPMR